MRGDAAKKSFKFVPVSLGELSADVLMGLKQMLDGGDGVPTFTANQL